MNFQPKLRFAVMSDIHYSDKYPEIPYRFQSALETIYGYCNHQDYKNLDALYVVGDFADTGTREQMQSFHDDCTRFVKPETKLVVTLANHELHYVPDYLDSFRNFEQIFQMDMDRHEVIGGYHFISLSTTIDKGPWHDSFDEPKRNFLQTALEKARQDGGNQPIFVFQHPGIFSTVRGGIYGNAELYPILSQYPQVIDFSGHSHHAVNDPREVHQKHFTSVNTGCLCGIGTRSSMLAAHLTETATDGPSCSHMLVVEANDAGRVRIRKLDVMAGAFFENDIWIQDAHLPENHCYTDRRAFEAKKPYFSNPHATVNYENNTLTLTIPRAECEDERIYEYHACVLDANGTAIAQRSLVSDFPQLHQKDFYTLTIPNVPNAALVKVYAIGFWENQSEPLTISL